jgi:hypothetical protein
MDKKQKRHTLRKGATDWLKDVGSLRDGFLVTAATFYFFGYIVWAINAYRNDLGLLPALEFQYFIAGAPLVVIILVLYSIVVASKRLIETVRKWIGPNPTGGKLYLCLIVFFLAVSAVVSIRITATEWFKAVFPNARSWVVIISALVIVVSPLFISQLENAFRKREVLQGLIEPLRVLLHLLGLVYAAMFFVGLAALAFVYSVELYPNIPQEFGGARPYYACLDIVKAQMSTETIKGVLPTDANKSQQPVVRSLRLEVLFSGSDIMLVRARGKVFKITKNMIQTVAMCDESEGKPTASSP